MLARRYRLTKKDNVEEIMTQGHVAQSRLFVVRYLPNNLPNHRTMALVSSKVADKAPARNKIRRQIYEVVRLGEKKNKEKGLASLTPFLHFDTVIFPKKAILEAPFKEIRRQLISLLHARTAIYEK